MPAFTLAEGSFSWSCRLRDRTLRRAGWAECRCCFGTCFGIRRTRFQGVVDDLTNLHVRVDANRLHCEHLQRPITAETCVSETRGHMYEKS